MNKFRIGVKGTCVLWILCTLSAAIAEPGTPEQQARQIPDETAIKGGLIVHLGCGNGRLSSVTVSGGRVFVFSIDSHTLHALDRETGTNT